MSFCIMIPSAGLIAKLHGSIFFSGQQWRSVANRGWLVVHQRSTSSWQFTDRRQAGGYTHNTCQRTIADTPV